MKWKLRYYGVVCFSIIW